MFIRRLGMSGMQACPYGHNCSQFLEMTDGDFVAVGRNMTKETVAALPPGPGVGADEDAVRIPRAVMLATVSDLLRSLK